MCDQVAVMYRGEIVERGQVAEVFAHPRHPYTQGLLGAVPDIESKDARLFAIPGEVAGPMTEIKGCPFHPRCILALNKCQGGEFSLKLVAEGHESACIRQADVATLGAVRGTDV
jgi:oligopeptide/dipeptide ABC transporter ATP-binding protein